MQWWLVTTSPSGDTTEAEQPVDSRTAACCTRSSQAWSMATPYVAFTAAAGKLSKVHRPSSARAAGPERPTAANAAPAMASERAMILLPRRAFMQALSLFRTSGSPVCRVWVARAYRVSKAELVDTLLQGGKFHHFIILTTIVPLKHDPVRRQSAQGPPAASDQAAHGLRFSQRASWCGRLQTDRE